MLTTQLIHRAVFYSQPTAGCTATVRPERVSDWLLVTYAAIQEYLSVRGVTPDRPSPDGPLEDGHVTIEAGYPVGETISGDGRIRPSSLPRCSAATAVHYGSLESVGDAYGEVGDWLADNGYVEDGSAWEAYLTDPAEHPEPDTWHTEVVVPYRVRLYTGAFILCATDAYGQKLKHLNHVELFRHMFLTEDLGKRLLDAQSLHEVYDLLHGFPLMGDFMSYQTTIDLNYSNLINFSENDFTQAGPGALRGIKICFADLGDY
jgi:effector-binding domain-containing protein